MNIISSQQGQPVNKGFRVDISRGQNIGRVSSEWFSRPDDERYLSLTELYDAVKARADRAKARTVESRAVRVEASREDAERLSLIVPGQDAPIAPTHWSFGQPSSCSQGAPKSGAEACTRGLISRFWRRAWRTSQRPPTSIERSRSTRMP